MILTTDIKIKSSESMPTSHHPINSLIDYTKNKVQLHVHCDLENISDLNT